MYIDIHCCVIYNMTNRITVNEKNEVKIYIILYFLLKNLKLSEMHWMHNKKGGLKV